jgi:hypothetical protein
MKTSNIIILLIVIVGIGFGVYFFKNKNKTNNSQPDNKPDKQPEKEKQPERQKPNPDKAVIELQKQINSLLPIDYPKLIVDGLYGPKTKAAIEFVDSLKQKNNLAKDIPVKTETGIIKIDTNAIYDNMKSASKFLLRNSPLGLAAGFIHDLAN